jgi:hypothetical protein
MLLVVKEDDALFSSITVVNKGCHSGHTNFTALDYPLMSQTHLSKYGCSGVETGLLMGFVNSCCLGQIKNVVVFFLSHVYMFCLVVPCPIYLTS